MFIELHEAIEKAAKRFERRYAETARRMNVSPEISPSLLRAAMLEGANVMMKLVTEEEATVGVGT